MVNFSDHEINEAKYSKVMAILSASVLGLMIIRSVFVVFMLSSSFCNIWHYTLNSLDSSRYTPFSSTNVLISNISLMISQLLGAAFCTFALKCFLSHLSYAQRPNQDEFSSLGTTTIPDFVLRNCVFFIFIFCSLVGTNGNWPQIFSDV